MSNNFDKIVKLACKPKNAPPKAKYVDALIAATFSDDGSINDITRSLSLRLREPNAVVVFKGLLTLHQMIRTGSTDTLLEHLCQGDVLRLRNISGQSWEGYSPPSNLGAYSNYLDARIKSFKDLKHDIVRVQAESNRRSDGLGAGSKARRLRHLPVEKGLLREVKQVQRVIEALIQCKFFDDDIRDENTVLAFRLLVKDLLVMFQAGNEGVCNILEHYFEMSKVDATESFEVYKSFIKQTDRVVDYLAVARKLHNVVNVPVPNLKHAPTSLVKALEEYLNDPNFERNRIEYKNSLGVVEGKGGASARTPSPNPTAVQSSSSAPPSSEPASAPVPAPSAPAGAPQKIQDFFDSIQADHQPTMFGGQQSNGFQPQMQQPQFNPFRQSMMMPQQTGFMQPQMTGFMPQMQMQQPQMTGFMQPQQTGAMAFGQHSPFGQPQMQQQQQFMQPQQQIQPQQTGFLQPQTTGSNPFRQSMLLPLHTGMPGASGALSQPSSPFGNRLHGIPESSSFGSQQISRPGSTPAFSAPLEPKPLTAQATGSKNPFAPATGSVPAVPAIPKGPSMNQLAMGNTQNNQGPSGFPAHFQAAPSPSSANGKPSPFGSLAGKSTSTGMTDIASSFTFDNKSKAGNNGGVDFMSQFGSMGLNGSNTGTTNSISNGAISPSASTNSTGFTSLQSQSTGFLQPQKTGFAGSTIKPFVPSSNFGSNLMESLSPIAGSPGVGSPHSPNSGGVQAQQTGFPGFNPSSGGNAFQGFNPSASNNNQGGRQQSVYSGLQAQTTGQANPFRQSMFAQPTGAAAFGNQPFGNQHFGSQPFGNPQPFGQQQTQNQSLI